MLIDIPYFHLSEHQTNIFPKSVPMGLTRNFLNIEIEVQIDAWLRVGSSCSEYSRFGHL